MSKRPNRHPDSTPSVPVFPFTAIVNQERLKRALVLNAINPQIGGVLIRGEKGTAKSTAVRALACLLPEIEVVPGCPYSCHPASPSPLCSFCTSQLRQGKTLPSVSRPIRVVELPVGATEERVLGTLDLERALRTGERHFEPGLLAAAHRGILYIDEVNLLNDHLVDVLLDAAAMGVNYVEREGVSVSHPARFILIGTMNPEEGELRPQLLDRFALAVEVEPLSDPELRAEVVRRRVAFEANPAAFERQWRKSQEQERARIRRAQRLLPRVQLPHHLVGLITRICCEYQVQGLRADIIIYKTALTLAAYDGRHLAKEEDIREAAILALLHRQRHPMDPNTSPWEALDRLIREYAPYEPEPGPSPQGPQQGGEGSSIKGEEAEPRVFSVGEPFPVRPLATPPRACPKPEWGRGGPARGEVKRGHYVGAVVPTGRPQDIAVDATLRAAAVYQKERQPQGPGLALEVKPQDLREKVRQARVKTLILFVVDASGSMGARQRMVAAKGAILSLLKDAYHKRDPIGMIAFRGTEAQLVLPPGRNFHRAERLLQDLPTGGRTPLAQGLSLALQTMDTLLHKDPGLRPLVVLISDGRPNVPLQGDSPVEDAKRTAARFAQRGIPLVVLDTEQGFVRLGIGRQLAEAAGGQYLELEELRADTVAGAVHRAWESLRQGPGTTNRASLA